ncbi:Hypothetical protein NTJ_14053 [Nesidiocoris tenuis]|uniref:DNA-directed RNA polymerase III subunit RPC4 n=1 Tax=Nesidiocoris tenuis TaxID=355587 RepID=A0ABN7BC38_9HEMI|nr:Hypothetical protein NTJ_14053 [Nesidiocoris tenuis]
MPMDQAPQSIKTEIGTYKRLPTFRSPRDLKLSQFQNVPASGQSAADGRPKKVFVPNLNASRLRNSENRTLNSQNVAESPKNDSANTARRESRGRRGGDERGRGRGRRPPREFIQQTGVFSQGLAPSMKTSSWNSSKYDSSPSVPAKPKLKANDHVKVSKEEEEEVMKELLRDDFIDDPSIEADLDNAPVQLPMQEFCKWAHDVDEKPLSGPSDFHGHCSSFGFMNGLKIKPDPEAEAEADEGSRKSLKAEPTDIQNMKPLSLAQLLSTSQEKNFLFFQIPHRIPNMRMTATPVVQPKRSGERLPEDEETNACVLRDLPQGRVGTLQIRKSGRATLLLGDVSLNVSPGTQSAFKQELISTNLENSTKSGNMINMGRITTRILVTPDWEDLLKKSK